MSVRSRLMRTASAGVLAIALSVPVTATAFAGPGPVPVPSAPVTAPKTPPHNPANVAAQIAYEQWQVHRSTRLKARLKAVEFTKDAKWTWDGIQPVLDGELAATRAEIGTLPATINRAAGNKPFADALRTYQARLTEYAAALDADRQARGSGDATWPKSNPANVKVTEAGRTVIALGDAL